MGVREGVREREKERYDERQRPRDVWERRREKQRVGEVDV